MFRGEFPAVAREDLPADAAQVAVNCRLDTGNIRPWRALGAPQDLPKAGPIAGLFPLDPEDANGGPYWLHWSLAELGSGQRRIDVAKGPVAGDTTERVYFTGTDAPRVTNRAKATTPPPVGGVGQYPYRSLLLGVPSPAQAPAFSVVAPAEVVAGSLAVGNAGSELGTTLYWTAVEGSLQVYSSGDVPGFAAAEGDKAFWGGIAPATRSYQDLLLGGAVEDNATAELVVNWQQAHGPGGSQARMAFEFRDRDGLVLGAVEAPLAAGGGNYVWSARELAGVAPDGTVVVRLFMEFRRFGAGTNDAYIDDIRVAIAGKQLVYSGEDLDGWAQETGPNASLQPNDTTQGWAPPSIRFRSKSNSVAAFYRDVGANASQSTAVQWDYFAGGTNTAKYIRQELVLGADADGSGGIGLAFDFDGIRIFGPTGWLIAAGAESAAGAGIHQNVVYTGIVTATKVGPATYEIVATTTRRDNGEIIATTGAVPFVLTGGYLGFRAVNSSGDARNGWIDNLSIRYQPQGAKTDIGDSVATAYVITYANEFGEIGAPSDPTETIVKSADAAVELGLPITAPAGYGVTEVWIWRRATGSTGGAFLLVDTVPLGTATYRDSKADSLLGEELYSDETWVLPPADMHSILMLANGIAAGASKNQLLLSPQGRPHVYPYQLPTDYRIVALGSIDTDLIVLTQSHPYIAAGAAPEQYTMAKIEYQQGCVSPDSVVSMPGLGVVYASPDGLVAIGRGAPQILTEGIWTQDQWTAMNPASLRGAVHNNLYFGFWKVDEATKGAWILDPRRLDRGITRLEIWAEFAYHDPYSDALYLVIGGDLVKWEGGAGALQYRYRERLNLLREPTSQAAARIRAVNYADITFRLFYDDVLVLQRAVTAEFEFNLPDRRAESHWYREIEGSSEIREWQIASDMESL